MATLKDELYNDFTNCYEINDGYQETMSKNVNSYQVGELYYFSPFLSFGDYDNSCAVERANVREFLKEYNDNKWIKHITGAYSHECIAVDVLCNDQELIDLLMRLISYPCINDETVSEVEQELAGEAWNNWIMSDVKDEIKKNFGIDLDDYNYQDEDLQSFFNNAAEQINEYGIVESGGNYWIDVAKVINNTLTLPANLTNNPL